ncbi:MAG: ribosome maturation factor RimM [Oscillospiraceae bacterium]|jgi:16S rRNA processing protein RimM|nr:ribosome maturation factor RimM [Oscillospiraceae bacterium]
MKKKYKEYLEVGKVTSPRGLKGEVRVTPWCDGPDFICDLSFLYLKPFKKLTIERCFAHKTAVIIKFKGIDNKQLAETLRGSILYINRKDVNLKEDSFFLQDIIGSEVVHADTGEKYGKVSDIIKMPANDVYSITSEDGKTYLMPAIKDILADIDIEKGVVLVRPMEGIFDNEV